MSAGRPHNVVRVLHRMMRVMVLLVGLQATGVLHTIIDVFERDEVGCTERCDSDDDRGNCPPLCQDCTCGHGLRPALTSPLQVPTSAILARGNLPVIARLFDPLPDPETDGIFHPPRS